MFYVEEYSTSVRYACLSGEQSAESGPYVRNAPRGVRAGITTFWCNAIRTEMHNNGIAFNILPTG